MMIVCPKSRRQAQIGLAIAIVLAPFALVLYGRAKAHKSAKVLGTVTQVIEEETMSIPDDTSSPHGDNIARFPSVTYVVDGQPYSFVTTRNNLGQWIRFTHTSPQLRVGNRVWMHYDPGNPASPASINKPYWIALVLFIAIGAAVLPGIVWGLEWIFENYDCSKTRAAGKVSPTRGHCSRLE